MKINWGTGIALVYGFFVVAMAGAVIASRRHDPGLVDKDYYTLDLNYQEHMEKKQNTANLAQGPAARYDMDKQSVVIDFPEGMTVSNGSIKLFRSAVVGDDRKVVIPPATNGQFQIPAGGFHPGLWHVELDWQSGPRKYFFTTTIQV